MSLLFLGVLQGLCTSADQPQSYYCTGSPDRKDLGLLQEKGSVTNTSCEYGLFSQIIFTNEHHLDFDFKYTPGKFRECVCTPLHDGC